MTVSDFDHANLKRNNGTPADVATALVRGKNLLSDVMKNGHGDLRLPLAELHTLAEQYADNDEVVDNYAMALIVVAREQPTPDALAAATTSRAIAARWPDSWRINSSHGVVLTALILRAIDFNPAELITELLALADRFDHDAFFDVRLASALKQAISRQQVDFAWGMQWLRQAAYAHPDKEDIVKLYVGAIVDHTKADDHTAPQMVPELEAFLAHYPYIESIRIALAKVLHNQIIGGAPSQPPPWERLWTLAQQYPQDVEISRWCALGLASAAASLDLAGRVWTASVCTSIAQSRPDDKTIGFAYVRCLFNLSLVQTGQARWDTIERIRQATDHFPGNAEIALRLAKALFQLRVADSSTRRVVLPQLRELAARYPGEAEIVQKARGW